MRFEGTLEIAAPRERVWAFLIDPRQVGPCGPGVESVDVVDATHFGVTARVGLGFLTADLQVALELLDLDPPRSATVQARTEAPGGSVDATAQLRLSDAARPGATVVDWGADVMIQGALAGVGERFIEGGANKMIGETFDCIGSKLEG